MINSINKVKEFHTTFLVEQSETPIVLDSTSAALRYKLGMEELSEYLEANEKGDLVEIADALGDQLYILFGTIAKHGLSHIITDVFNEIHSSNMSKLGEDGKPIFREDKKVLKGPNYFRPDIKTLLSKYLETLNA